MYRIPETIRNRASVCLGTVLGLLSGSVHAAPLTVNDVVVVNFEFTAPPPATANGPVDLLDLIPIASGIPEFSDVTVKLFDGATLLGTYEANNHRSAYFRDAASQYRFGNPTVIDFTSIRDGTIDGRIEYQITRLPELNTLTLEDTVAVEFRFPAPPEQHTNGPVDVLVFPINYDFPEFSDVTVRLYDGETLLGTYDGRNKTEAVFSSVDSVYQVGNPSIVDFTSIRDGTIDGKIEYQITRLPSLRTITAEDTVVVEFQLSNPPPVHTDGPVDVFIIPVSYDVPGNSDITVSLYDGDTLLGTYTGLNRTDAVFVAPGSSYLSGNPTIIDFTTLRDGTIDGRVEYRITRLPDEAASVDINLYKTSLANLGKSNGTNSYTSFSATVHAPISLAYIKDQPDNNTVTSIDINLYKTGLTVGRSLDSSAYSTTSPPYSEILEVYIKNQPGEASQLTANVNLDSFPLRLRRALNKSSTQSVTVSLLKGDVYTYADDDNDGVANIPDNCPQLANPDQANNDNDDLGDLCDTDDDNDGVTDLAEVAAGRDPFFNEALTIVPLLPLILD